MDYQKQASDMLANFGITFSAELLGNDCPPYCTDKLAGKDMDKLTTYPRKTHIHGKHYACFLKRLSNNASVFFDFWNSYADEEYNALGSLDYRHGDTIFKYGERAKDRAKPATYRRGKREVQPYDLLACVQKYDPGSFHDFCADFGYDEDSRHAENTYHAVQSEWRKVREFFTAEELKALQEIS